MPRRRVAKKKKGRSKWLTHVMKTYRANKKGGFSAALRRAKKTYRK